MVDEEDSTKLIAEGIIGMRIMYVNDAFAIKGGIERVLADKINYLSSVCGYDICLLTANQGMHPHAYGLEPSVKYVDVGISFHNLYRYHGIKRWIKTREYDRLFMERVRQQIDAFCPDIIISARPFFMKPLSRLKNKALLIHESHSSCKNAYFEQGSFFKRMHEIWQIKKLKKMPMMVIALTDGDAREWHKLFPQYGVKVVPNIVTLNDNKNASAQECKRIIFVGRLEYQKGLDDLIKIWELVQKKHDDWQLDIYGDGTQKARLQSVIQERKLHVNLWGSVDHIFEYYMRSSMLLLTSVYEPFGLVMPEAMSCGLPVVAFDCPYGPADIVSDGVDGFLIKNRDVKAFADRVCQLIEDKELRQKMGKAAIQSAQRYTPEKIMPLWKELFESLLNK